MILLYRGLPYSCKLRYTCVFLDAAHVRASRSYTGSRPESEATVTLDNRVIILMVNRQS